MHSINFLKKNKRSFKRTAFILLAFLVFIAAIFASHFLLSQKMPWGKKVWFELSKIVPVPIANISGQNIYYRDYQTATKMGSEDPLAFIVEQGAIKAIAKNLNLSASPEEIGRAADAIQDKAAYLRERGVSVDNFDDVFVVTDILKSKIIMELNQPSAKVGEVEAKLAQEDADFATIARSYSDDPITAPLGGDAGFISEMEIGTEAWQAAKDLSNGEWTGPVNTASGYLFVQKNGRQPAQNGQPEKLSLRVIQIKVFDFEIWLQNQIKKMDVKLYI